MQDLKKTDGWIQNDFSGKKYLIVTLMDVIQPAGIADVDFEHRQKIHVAFFGTFVFGESIARK